MNRRSPAFTLVELLVVIAIIAILAGMIFPVMGFVRARGDTTKCLSNLRQVGTAISAYASDNSGTLPGPLTREQKPTFDPETNGSLPKMLAKYVGQDDKLKAGASTPTARDNIFACPSYLREFRQMEGAVYSMNMREMTDYKRPPWGDPGAVGQEEPGDDLGPVKIALLTAWEEINPDMDNARRPVDLARVFAIKDTDAKDPPDNPVGNKANPSPIYPLALKPVHGDHRNAVFYDLHGGQLKALDNKPK